MDTLNLQFDLDGDGTILNPGLLDFPDTDGTTYGAAHTIADASNKLLRKVTNAIWEAGRGECGVLGPCYNNASKDSWEASMFHPDGNNTDLFDDITANSPINLKASRLIAIGAIETTDTLNLGDNVLYAGRYTFYARDSDSGGAGVGRINWYGNSYAIPSYRYPPTSLPATYVAFPCQNVMGLMTPEDIDDSNTAPGDDLQGAFYATGVIHLTKQHQIMGAMVSAAWDFGTGGNPDYFQAMEISRCLPPYIIAKDVIVFADSVSWLER